jgi:hypothetical protein
MPSQSDPETITTILEETVQITENQKKVDRAGFMTARTTGRNEIIFGTSQILAEGYC